MNLYSFYIGFILNLCWIYIEFVLVLYWLYIEFMLNLYWIYVEFMLVYWLYIEFMLNLYWIYIEFQGDCYELQLLVFYNVTAIQLSIARTSSIMSGFELGFRGSISATSRSFPLHSRVRTRSQARLDYRLFQSTDIGGSYRKNKPVGASDHSPRSDVGNRDPSTYTSGQPYSFITWFLVTRTNGFIFTFAHFPVPC